MVKLIETTKATIHWVSMYVQGMEEFLSCFNYFTVCTYMHKFSLNIFMII